jgi:glycosyltransferase involved in cell wall biosynthesis
MRLALVIPGFQSDENDWCIPAFTNLARILADQVDLHVFALRYPQRRDDYTLGKVRVHSIGAGAIFGTRIVGVSLLKLWSDFARTFGAEHASAPFDAVIGVWVTESGWLATRSAQEFNIPSLVHIAGGELINLPYMRYGNRSEALAGRMVRATLSRADLLTVPSEPVMRALHRMPDVPDKEVERRARRWSLGVDTQMFAPNERVRPAERPITFVTVGSLVPVKGHRLLIEAFARLRHSRKKEISARLRIVGDGPLRSALLSLVTDFDLEGYVTFDGEVPHQDLPAIYNECDAFLLGSYYEAQCMAVLEAMSCGLPWVAPLVGCIPDVARSDAEETPTGLTFDSRKPAQVAASLRSMIDLTAEERHRWGLHARERVLRDYELNLQTDRLLSLVSGLLPQN